MKKAVIFNALAIAAGFIATLILTRGTDIFLESVGIFPTVREQQQYGFNVLWMNILALFYRVVYTTIGGYLTAKTSDSHHMRNVRILGIIGTIVALIGNIVVSQIPEMANVLPVWFSVVLVIIAYPFAILGGRLAAKYTYRRKDKTVCSDHAHEFKH
jgi:hypothetical protein